ncbi:hypothetical protein A2U01_0080618, partial [Trifolium medium]|nr:hypothetical protein [Trifolium medium]
FVLEGFDFLVQRVVGYFLVQWVDVVVVVLALVEFVVDVLVHVVVDVVVVLALVEFVVDVLVHVEIVVEIDHSRCLG